MPRKKIKPKIPQPPDAGAPIEELTACFEKYRLDELEAAGYVHELSPAERQEMDKLATARQQRVAERKKRRTQ